LLKQAADIEQLIPHTADMSLLSGVLSFDDTSILCVSDQHLNDANPLKEQGVLGSWLMVEYGAQAAAVHRALLAEGGEGLAKTAYLAQLKSVSIKERHITNEILDIKAICLSNTDMAAAYQIEIYGGDKLLLGGRVTLSVQS
jgi:predicted hotdog family 3-hydroxylacyl-ACP dehydratase